MKSDAPTRVVLLRHAEMAAPDLFHGAESEIGLSERGRQQAEAIAPVLAAERPVAVISSRAAVVLKRPTTPPRRRGPVGSGTARSRHSSKMTMIR